MARCDRQFQTRSVSQRRWPLLKPDPTDEPSPGVHGAPLLGPGGVGSVRTRKRGLQVWQSSTLPQTDVSESHVAKLGRPAPGSPSATQPGFGEGGDPNGSFSSPCRSCSHDGRSFQLPRKGILQAVLPPEKGASPHPCPRLGCPTKCTVWNFTSKWSPNCLGDGEVLIE